MTRKALPLLFVLALGACRDGPSAVSDAGATQQALSAIVATCAATQGPAQVKRPGAGYWEELRVGSVLRPGDWVRTGAAGFTRIEFIAGGGLELSENALLVIDRAPRAQDAGEDDVTVPLIAIQQGEARGFSRTTEEGSDRDLMLKLSDGSTVRVGAKMGGAAEYRVTAENGQTRLSVSFGHLRVIGTTAETVLGKGQTATVLATGAQLVEELLGFPEIVSPGIDARFVHRKGMTVGLEWSKVPAASGYRVQLARDLAFRDVVATAVAEDVRHGAVLSGPGLYVWRVASRDGKHRFGEYGFARRIYIEEVPLVDALVAPAMGAVINTESKPVAVRFDWRAAPDAGEYRLVVSAAPDLTKAVETHVTEDSEFEVPALAPGEYVWGVFAEGAQPQPLFSEPRRLTVKKLQRRVKTPDAIDQWGRE